MSKERDALKKAIGIINFTHPNTWHEFISEVEELLAQPEQSSTPRHALDSYWNQEAYQRGYAQAELDLKREPLSEEESYHEAKRLYEAEDGLWYEDGFVDGLKFAEKMHGIGGE